jgi:sugar O-acyltransferase (sialic acid O-acetyltransferase NeuD family)
MKKDKIVTILGAGGFAREIYSTVTRAGYDVFCFIDQKDGGEIYGINIKSIDSFTQSDLNFCNNFVLAVGHPDLKLKLLNEINSKFQNKINFPSIVDPSAIIENIVSLGKGTVICAGSILTTDITIGDFVHINLNCTIGHDCVINDFCQFSPGVNISGYNKIGKNVYFGTNSCSLENLTICDNVTIGAGGVVVKNIRTPGVYVGIPAKLKG